MRSATRTALYLSGAGAVGVNSLVMWPLLGRELSAADLGALVTVLAASALLAPVATVGLHVYVVRFLAGGSAAERSSAASTGFVVTLVLGAMALSGLVASRSLGASALVVACVLAHAAALVAVAAARGLDRPLLFAVATSVVQVGGLLAALVAAAAGRSLDAVLLVLVSVVSAGSLFLGLPLLASAAHGGSSAGIRSAVQFAAPLVPHLVLSLAIAQGIRVLLAATDGAESAGVFQFAALLGGGGVTLVITLSSHWGTDTLRTKPEDFPRAVQLLAQRLLMVSVAVIVLTTVFMRYALPYWLPPQTPRGTVMWAVVLLLPAVVAQAWGDTCSAILMRLNRTFAMSMATAVGAATSAGVFLVLRWVSPVQAAAAAVSMALIVRALVLALVVTRSTSYSPTGRRTPTLVALGGVVVATAAAAFVARGLI